jgi:hypothetical protein
VDIQAQPIGPKPKGKKGNRNAPQFDLRTELYRIAGIDWAQIIEGLACNWFFLSLRESVGQVSGKFLVGPPIIVQWSRLFAPQTQAHCLLEPRACSLSTACRLTYGISRTGAAKNRFLAEASIEQTNHPSLDYRRDDATLHPISYSLSMSFFIHFYPCLSASICG